MERLVRFTGATARRGLLRRNLAVESRRVGKAKLQGSLCLSHTIFLAPSSPPSINTRYGLHASLLYLVDVHMQTYCSFS
jgi:hypothetical protein